MRWNFLVKNGKMRYHLSCTQAKDSGVRCLRRAVAAAISPDVFAFLQQNHQVNFAEGLMMMECAQAGLEDFAYMEGVADEAQLKERIVVTGAEVNIQFLFSVPPSQTYQTQEGVETLQAGLRNCIWADSFAVGVVARWTKQ